MNIAKKLMLCYEDGIVTYKQLLKEYHDHKMDDTNWKDYLRASLNQCKTCFKYWANLVKYDCEFSFEMEWNNRMEQEKLWEEIMRQDKEILEIVKQWKV